jgi:acetyl-CoA C-acetyltransferase
MQDDPVVVLSGARTAIGKFGGGLKDVDAHVLGATVITTALERAGMEPADVEEVVMGEIGQNGPDVYNARRCAITAGIPAEATAMNVNRLCSSGLQAIVTGATELLVGQADVVVAGGNESMSRQPFLDYSGRDGYRLGPRKLLDGTLAMVTDPFGNYPMGVTAERVAERYSVPREEQDEFAARSQQRATAAIADGAFAEEIVPVTPPRSRNGAFATDEHPRADVTVESLAQLKPVFEEGGTVTVGNSSGINDGAAAVVLMRSSEARRRKLEPRLVLRGWAVSGIDPDYMGYAPALAIPKLLEKQGLTVDDIDLVELNEAFAAQAVPVIRDVGLDPERVNPWGGAIALGHPVGATGAILTVKLMHGLERTGGRRGIVTMCIGGGQGMAALFEQA